MLKNQLTITKPYQPRHARTTGADKALAIFRLRLPGRHRKVLDVLIECWQCPKSLGDPPPLRRVVGEVPVFTGINEPVKWGSELTCGHVTPAI